MPDMQEMIEVENVNAPGRTSRLNRAKYEAMRDALLAVLPSEAPGLKVADAKAALLPILPAALHPRRRQGGVVAEGRAARSGGQVGDRASIGSPVRLFKTAD